MLSKVVREKMCVMKSKDSVAAVFSYLDPPTSLEKRGFLTEVVEFSS